MTTFRKEGLKFPKRGQGGSGEIVWQEITEAMALDTLHNPRYAGTYCFGRSRHWKDAQGKRHSKDLPLEQWRYVLKGAHPGYLSWEQFLANDAILRKNHQVVAGQRSYGTAREGPALLQGLAVCGRCGRMMTVRYHYRQGRLRPEYLCQKDCVEAAQAPCQRIPGGELDEAVGKLLIETVTPLALEVALNVQAEIQTRLEQADRLRRQHVQRTQYEADQAKLRFMRVDPNNRLVADTLESDWNGRSTHRRTEVQGGRLSKRFSKTLERSQNPGPRTETDGPIVIERCDAAARSRDYCAASLSWRRLARVALGPTQDRLGTEEDQAGNYRGDRPLVGQA